jgi:hypothetical protein
MKSDATTVEAYLAALPEDRRTAIEAVRKVILDNLDADYEEGIQYGMIGYYVPHRVYPAGYHCDPKQPLPFAALASQKGYMSVYLMCIYGHEALRTRFEAACAKAGKKLDMGKSCVRFKKVDDLALDAIGEAIRQVPARRYIEYVESALATASAARTKPNKSGAATEPNKSGKRKQSKRPQSP